MSFIIPLLAITQHGGNRVLIALANKLAERGFDVSIYSTTNNRSTYYISPDVEVKVFFSKLSNKYFRYLFFLISIPWVCRRGDIISNHFLTYYPCQLCCSIFGGNNYYFVQGVESEAINYLPKTFLNILKFINYRTYRSKKIITANQYLNSVVSQFTKPFFSFQLGVNGVFLADQKSVQVEKEYNVIYFARREKNKGLDRFLSICRSNPNLKFLCVSQDERLIDELDLETNVFGMVPSGDPELINAIDAAEVVLLTSYYEGFSLPPLECMARGLPLIYFDCGGPDVYCNESNSIKIFGVGDFEKSFNNIKSNMCSYSKSSKKTSLNNLMEDSIDDLISFISTNSQLQGK